MASMCGTRLLQAANLELWAILGTSVSTVFVTCNADKGLSRTIQLTTLQAGCTKDVLVQSIYGA